MRDSKLLLAAIVGCSLFASDSLLADTPPYCPTTTGNWAETDLYTGWYLMDWNLSQSGASITGTANAPYSQCPGVWPVTGTYQGGGYFVVRQTNPFPPTQQCVAWVELYATVLTPGCNYGYGTWLNSSGYSNYASKIEKPCEIPTGETTAPYLPAGPLGLPAAYQYQITLLPMSTNFDGRRVRELPGSAVDECYAPGLGIDPTDGTSVGAATVAPGNFYYDNIGYPTFTVDVLRSNGRTPCTVTIYQAMVAECDVSAPQFASNTITITVNAMNLTVSRSGQSAVINY